MTSKESREVGSIYPNVIIPLPEKSEKSHLEITKSSGDIKSHNFLIKYVKKKTENFSKRQIVILCVFSFVDLLAATVVSLQAPFYPEVASAKGASATEYGLVFGIFEFTAIIASPLFGANMRALGPKRVFTGGILTTGICSMIFGLLHKIEGSGPFIGSCLVVRVFEAIGESAYVTASFTIIAMAFPNAVGMVFAILETCYGLGMIVGPTLGGFLYELGGYSLPFLFMGGLLFLSALITCIVLPTEDSKAESSIMKDDEGKILTTSSPKMFELIKIPVIAMTSYGIVATATGVGFLCALLEPHLRQFGLDKVAVGSVFILSGGVYAITAPFWGYVCDHMENPKLLTLFGSMFSVMGLALIGPLPFLPFDTVLWVTCVGQTLFGLGMGAIYVSGFIIYLNDAINRGYPDDVSTYGLVSGLWTAMVSLGYFIGPTVGGILDDHIGFRWGSLFVIGAELILMMMIIIFLMKTCRKGSAEYKVKSSKDNTSIDLKGSNVNSIDKPKLRKTEGQSISKNNMGCVS